MVNAVYFKGNWEEEFEKYLTEPIPFHIDEKTTKDANMMFKRKNFNYGTLSDLDAIFVELPYKVTYYSQFIPVKSISSELICVCVSIKICISENYRKRRN